MLKQGGFYMGGKLTLDSYFILCVKIYTELRPSYENQTS